MWTSVDQFSANHQEVMFKRSSYGQEQSWTVEDKTQALFLTLFTSDVKLDVYNRAELRDSANVMGVIWGSVEPGKLSTYLYIQHVSVY